MTSQNFQLLDLLGGYWRAGWKHSRIVGLFRTFKGDEQILFTTLEGLTPANNKAFIQGKLRHAPCSPESFDWSVDERQPVNPGLLVQQDFRDVSYRAFGWPIENRRRQESVVEHHLLDEVVADLVESSQD
jgi:hypothetical protein